ncbi:MAG: efflux RND transporter periplasmic adaptor subunit [Syntrophobacterales bacterium]|nr:efflux RND transporter periplasmic adaptor subunit [Syntrophobacterales bacterium]
MTKRMIIMLVLIGLLLGGVFGFKAFVAQMMKKGIAAQASPPQTVSVAQAEIKEWQPQIDAVGSLKASRGADLTSEVTGVVSKIHFQSGSIAKAGKLLIEIDSQADMARLQVLKAALELAKKTYARNQEQFKEHAVSQATLDANLADLKSTEAQVAEQQAILNKKNIRAPFDGRLGIRHVSPGQYLSPGVKIVTIQALDTIFFDFTLPQQDIGNIRKGQAITVKVDAFPEQTFNGVISAIEPKIEEKTRNVGVRASMENAQQKLLPGMFATARIATGKPQKHITVPQTAIVFNPYGNVVFIVGESEEQKDAEGKPALTVMQRLVKTGAARGNEISVLEGLQDGDTIVTSGQIKLQNGTRININNDIQPSDNPNPELRDD